MLAHLCGPDRKIIRSGINKFPTVSPNISRRRRRIQENFAEQAGCWSGISRICRKIDSRVNVRIDTQPPGYGSEPHLDFIVTDLDGMLARLCGPDRKIIRLRDKRGIYLFLIEITAITKYLADADGGSRRILRSRPDCGAEFPKYAGISTPRCFVQTGAAVGPGLGALVTRHDLNCVPPYIEIPLVEIEFGVAILRRW